MFQLVPNDQSDVTPVTPQSNRGGTEMVSENESFVRSKEFSSNVVVNTFNKRTENEDMINDLSIKAQKMSQASSH